MLRRPAFGQVGHRLLFSTVMVVIVVVYGDGDGARWETGRGAKERDVILGFNHRVKHDENGLGWKNHSFVVIARWGREKKRLLPPNIPTPLRFICPNEPLLLNPSCYLMGEMGEAGETAFESKCM